MIIQLRIWCGWPITNRTHWALFDVWSGRGDIVQCTYTWPPAAWRWLLGWLVGWLVGEWARVVAAAETHWLIRHAVCPQRAWAQSARPNGSGYCCPADCGQLPRGTQPRPALPWGSVTQCTASIHYTTLQRLLVVDVRALAAAPAVARQTKLTSSEKSFATVIAQCSYSTKGENICCDCVS